MSRGHGWVERSALAVLQVAGDCLDTFNIAAAAFYPDERGDVLVTDAQLSAVRRALGKLVREGLVVPVSAGFDSPERGNQSGRGWRDRRKRWLAVSALPAYQARQAASLDRLAAAIAADRAAGLG